MSAYESNEYSEYCAPRPASAQQPTAVRHHPPCTDCHLAHDCLPAFLDPADAQRLGPAVRALAPLPPGRSLFENGVTRGEVFVVRSGCLRTSIQETAGSEQVVGFHLVGDVVGFGANGSQFRGERAVALERSSVCAIHVATVHSLASRLPGAPGQLHALVERAMSAAGEHTLVMGRRTAMQRVALFLLTWSHRQRRAGFPDNELHLPMRREDLASYLGLVAETASRAFSRLQADGLLSLDDRHSVTLRDRAGLATAADIEPDRLEAFASA